MNLRPEAFEVLQTLGYPVYVRRSLLKERQQQAVAVTAMGSVQKKADAPKVKPSSLEETRVLANKVATNNKVEKSQSVVQNWPEMHLYMVGISGEVLVMFGQGQQSSHVSEKNTSLIASMLAKCCIPGPCDFRKEFHWPLFPHEPLNQSMEVALQALAGVVHRSRVEHKWQWLLLMGKEASAAIFGQSPGEYGQKKEYLGMKLLYTLPIEDLIISPDKRKETWEHLQPLRQQYA